MDSSWGTALRVLRARSGCGASSLRLPVVGRRVVVASSPRVVVPHSSPRAECTRGRMGPKRDDSAQTPCLVYTLPVRRRTAPRGAGRFLIAASARGVKTYFPCFLESNADRRNVFFLAVAVAYSASRLFRSVVRNSRVWRPCWGFLKRRVPWGGTLHARVPTEGGFRRFGLICGAKPIKRITFRAPARKDHAGEL